MPNPYLSMSKIFKNPSYDTLKYLLLPLRIFTCWSKYFFSNKIYSECTNLKAKHKCIVLLAADYGNLGDVAITYAQEMYLKELFPDYEIVDVPLRKTAASLKKLKEICHEGDIITLTGGGYMGSLYFRAELLRQLVFQVFKHNLIISFPQTAVYSQTLFGEAMKRRSIGVYSHCDNLELWLREEKSFKIASENFTKNRVRLIPDVVMTLDRFNNAERQNLVTFCLRNDKEKGEETDGVVSLIKKYFTQKKTEIQYYDTHIGRVQLSLQRRIEELVKIKEQFQRSCLVVTDRLHGMIFAYVTGTPAIVLKNNNYKIIESYKWIKDCGYIYMVNDNDELEKLLHTDFHSTREGFLTTHNRILEAYHHLDLFQSTK